MSPPPLPRRRKDRVATAVHECQSGRMSQRDAAKYFNIPRATLQYAIQQLHKPIRKKGGRPCALGPAEEGMMIKFLGDFANKGVPLSAKHVEEAVEIIVSHMSPVRRAKLPFRNGKPGIKWVRNFIKRYKEVIKFSKPTKQEAARFAACNGEVLATHFATVEKIISENNIDAERMWNLDEAGVTPGKDVNARTRSKKVMTRSSCQDVKIPNFSYDKRVTLMPTISAAGQTGPCLFVFKGRRIPYRNVLRNGNIISESPLSVLPRGSVCAVREECGGIDQVNFRNWARCFVLSVKDLTANGRKVLLIYDAYRSHLSLEVLQYFERNNIIVYALPAHTSGKTQPLDVVVFSVFKRELNRVMDAVATREESERWDVFKLCSLMRHAYERALTVENIRSAFCRPGLWPLDSSKLLSVPRPAGSQNLDVMLDKNQLHVLFQKKRAILRDQVLGEDAVLHSSGYVDTRCGEVMTSSNALSLIEAHVNRRRAAINSSKLLAKKKALQEQRKKEARDKKKALLREFVDIRRAKLCKETLDVYRKHVRSLDQRRALAKLNAVRRTQVPLSRTGTLNDDVDVKNFTYFSLCTGPNIMTGRSLGTFSRICLLLFEQILYKLYLVAFSSANNYWRTLIHRDVMFPVV